VGKLDTAESLYREALALRPGDADMTSELGILLVAMNRHREGKELLEAADTEASGHERAVGALGLAYLQDGNLEKAFALLKQSLAMQFNNEALMTHFAATGRELGRLEEVEPLLRRFVDFFPGNVSMTYEYARLLCDQREFAQARDRLETLLLLSPSHEGAMQLLRQIAEETE
jgi:Tfp pilus assembly protein PilF